MQREEKSFKRGNFGIVVNLIKGFTLSTGLLKIAFCNTYIIPNPTRINVSDAPTINISITHSERSFGFDSKKHVWNHFTTTSNELYLEFSKYFHTGAT